MSEADDRRAIVELIHRNRISIWMRDYDAWASCFVHAPYTVRYGWWHLGGSFFRRGWDNISTRLLQEMHDYPEPQPRLAYDTTVENLNLRVLGDMAWATYEQRYPEFSFEPYGRGPVHIYEARVFERHQGTWKIAFLGMVEGERRVDPDQPQLRLDAEGRVLSDPEEVAAVLADDDLVVRNGRLRIRDSRTDARLQAAIRWAAGLDRSHMPGRGAMPVVMEAGEGLPTRVWWVSGQGGQILFSVGNQQVSERRLDLAAMIYGLSAAQRRVAAYVAEGLTLPDIASRMQITPNTVRTHLQRIYEKTGVRNQAALVRMLLSAVAPG